VAETLVVSGETARLALWIVVLASAVVFAVGALVRAIGYARQPLHLRWELYPVPHEPASRAAYGGSRFEGTDWWARPLERDPWNAARAMAREIALLRGLWEANRSLWYRSYPFHLGLYLVVAATKLLLLAAIADIVAPGLRVVEALASIGATAGTAGLALAVAGAVALMHWRLTAHEARVYTTPGDITNLALFIVAFGFLLGGVVTNGSEAPSGAAVARAVLTLDGAVAVHWPVALGLTLSALVAAYIPCTHMAHFVAKYFTYHAVRWDDEPNLGDGRIQRAIATFLTYRPTWSAPHVGADGRRTWADVVVMGGLDGPPKPPAGGSEAARDTRAAPRAAEERHT
jgi:nitrate reductase gamma subunit